ESRAPARTTIEIVLRRASPGIGALTDPASVELRARRALWGPGEGFGCRGGAAQPGPRSGETTAGEREVLLIERGAGSWDIGTCCRPREVTVRSIGGSRSQFRARWNEQVEQTGASQ